MWPKGIWGPHHRTWKRKTLGGFWPHGSKWQHLFSLSWGQDSAWTSPQSLWLSGSFGLLWALLVLSSLYLCAGALFQFSPHLSYAVGMSTSFLPSGRTDVVFLSSALLLTLVWWMDLGTSWLPCLRLLMGLTAMTTWLWPMFSPCGTASCWWEHQLYRVTCGSWLISAHGTAVFVLLLDAAPTETGFSPVRKHQREIQSNHLECLMWGGGL